MTLPSASANSAYRHSAAIVSMKLPTDTVTLQPDQNYLWALMLVCNSRDRAEDIVVDVTIQRIGSAYEQQLADDLAAQLSNLEVADDIDRLSVYTQAGLWQDLITDLAALAQADPEQYSPVWTNLLTNQGLGAIATMPLYEGQLTPLIDP